MALQEYADYPDLVAYGFEPGPKDEDLFRLLIPRASRIIDRLCGVAGGYFTLAGLAATVRSVAGSGTRFLRLPPYVAGSITTVVLDPVATLPSYVEKDGYLVAGRNEVWDEDYEVNITARWGFEAIPEDIREATIELSLAIWRQRDSGFARVSTEVNGASVVNPPIPDRTKKICEAWRANISTVFT